MVLALGVSLTVAAGTTAVSAVSVGSATAPVDTSAETPTDSAPVDTETPAPSTAPVDSAPAVTSELADPVTPSDPTVADEQEDSVSAWWWVAGGLVAFAAVAGIAFSLRRRTDDETWARTASTTCDTGRALAASIESHLNDAATWAPPERVEHQRARFSAYLDDGEGTAPNIELAELWTAVSAHNDALGVALDALEIGTPIGIARETLAPSLHGLADALTALEHEAATVVYGVALPSTRTTG